ncbi:hypothetical protein ACFYTF_29000 [Nocardia thailandica]|uniref:Uncharacterized protein n=1 Tax=Nocardia thailandica TaxID=257275 RepID=A0ABW6PWU7_9NOCA
MSSHLASAAVQLAPWSAFWMQLPVLVLVLAVLAMAITALLRANREDIPRIVEAIVATICRRLTLPAGNRRRPRRAGAIEEDTKW